jgi:hypothetical protein
VNDELKGSGGRLILRNYPGIRLDGCEENQENSQNSQSPDRDLNPGPLEYEAGVLTIRT